MMVNEKRFVKERKRLLKEYNGLLCTRVGLNKKMRQVKSDMDAWDKALFNNV
jgi:hypothetical protein